MTQQKVINVARGLEKAELVIKNANIVNVLSEEIHQADIAQHQDDTSQTECPSLRTGEQSR